LIFVVSIGVMVISILATASVTPVASDDGSVKKARDIRIGFIDHDGSAVAADMKSYFEDELGISFMQTSDAGELNSDLVNKRISGIAELPEGFERALLDDHPRPVELTFLDDYTNEAFIRGYFHSYTDALAVLAAASGQDAQVVETMLAETGEHEPDVTSEAMDEKLTRQESDKEGYRFMLGFFMMFSFMMSIIISQMLHTDRLDGTFRRIRASSATPTEYVVALAGIGFVISLLIEAPALLIWNLIGSYSVVPTPVTVLMLFAFATLVNSFAIFIGIAMPSFNGIIAVTVSAATITSLLGGAWFPLELAPPLFKTLSRITPQHWMYEIVRSFEDGSGQIGIPIAILLLAALLFLILSGILFSGNKAGARTLAR
jgi:ABC-2 type transport system permease protein